MTLFVKILIFISGFAGTTLIWLIAYYLWRKKHMLRTTGTDAKLKKLKAEAKEAIQKASAQLFGAHDTMDKAKAYPADLSLKSAAKAQLSEAAKQIRDAGSAVQAFTDYRKEIISKLSK